MSNVGVSQCKFCGINVGKGINAGVETMQETSKKTEGLDAVEHKLNYEEETV